MSSNLALEDVILALAPAHRQVVADLRLRNVELNRRLGALEIELSIANQRIEELELQVKIASQEKVTVQAPITTLHELLNALRVEHTQAVDVLKKKASEASHSLDDPGFDPVVVLHQAVGRSLRALPQNFEFVDLVRLREAVTQDGHVPSSPLQAPVISEFVSHIDGVRQCTKDGRFAHLFFDPIKIDVLRKIFDVCKAVENRMAQTGNFNIPSQAINFDQSQYSREGAPIGDLRLRESELHVNAIQECGEIFDKATKEVQTLVDTTNSAQTLPQLLVDFEIVLQTMTADLENLQHNEHVIREGAEGHIEHLQQLRMQLKETGDKHHVNINFLQKEIEANFNEMELLLQKSIEGYKSIIDLTTQNCSVNSEMALMDKRISEIKKATEVEVSKQQKFIEGCKFTTYLTNKAKDVFKRLFSNLEEMLRSRKELCERTKSSTQEQLYLMAENYHDLLVKRINQDTNRIRLDQQALDATNRSMMGVVHIPQEVEKHMGKIRQLTMSIAEAKNRLQQSTNDIGVIKSLLQKYGTLQFLKRETSFLVLFEAQERNQKLKDKIDEALQRSKFVSEALVEVSDPDTRQDYVVQQCLDALKSTVTEVNDLLPFQNRVAELDEPYRVQAATRLKRHKRLLSHFLEEMEDNGGELAAQEPAIEIHAQALQEGLGILLTALTNSDEPVPLTLAQSYLRASVHEDSSTAHPTAASARRKTSVQFGNNTSQLMAASGEDTFFEGEQIEQQQQQEQVEEEVAHSFARASDRIRISHDQKRITKAPTGMEMSNTSAIGSVGLRINTGIHAYRIRIIANCTRLLVGFSDWNLPLDGYCNSLKYPCCYYLHLGNGTLWCPEQHIERKQYTYEAIGSSVNEILMVVLNTVDRTISYVFRDQNLGIAFKNVNLSRTFYPAFEVFSNNCSVEFVSAQVAKLSAAQQEMMVTA